MPLTKAERLQIAAEREARLQDRLVESFARELLQVLKLATRKVRTLIRQMDRPDRTASRVARQQALGRAIQLRRDLTRLLEEAGYQRLLLEAMDAPLDRLAAETLKTHRIANSAASLSAVSVDTLGEFRRLRLAELLGVGEDIGPILFRTVLDGVLSVRPTDELIADLEDALDTTYARARTVYDTAVSTYTRQVEQTLTSGEPDELFLYVGPVDGKAREFCLKRVGRVYTRAQIDKMDNGQLPNVFIVGGGWGCRHMWKRVSILDEELQELAGTTNRLPHIQEQVDEVVEK